MRAVETFFAFHPRKLSQVWTAFGHVEAFGYTRDDTWFFFDPARKGTQLLISHHHDEVEQMMAGVISKARTVYRTDERFETFLPAMLPQTCVSQCAALIGLRAFTIGTFERKLRAINAEVIHAKR